MLVQNFPERFSLTKLLGATAAERKDPASQMNSVFWWLHPRRGEVRLQGVRIAMNKIKDAVAAGIHACDQIGPGHGTLGWNAGGEEPKRSFLSQDREVRHLAFGHELFQKLRVHAVDTEDD